MRIKHLIVADDEIVLKEGDPEIKDEAQEPIPTA